MHFCKVNLARHLTDLLVRILESKGNPIFMLFSQYTKAKNLFSVSGKLVLPDNIRKWYSWKFLCIFVSLVCIF